MACPVFIAPGNHDPYTPYSPYAAENWPENVHIFRSLEMEAVELPELGCVVHGCAFAGPERTDQALAGFTVPTDGKCHLMCLHGDVGVPGQHLRSCHPAADREQRPCLPGSGPYPPVQRCEPGRKDLLGLPRLS